jgi:hypothetical protein
LNLLYKKYLTKSAFHFLNFRHNFLQVSDGLTNIKVKIMKTRFNKDNVLIHIEKRMKQLEDKWGFNPNNGYAQVVDSDFQRVIAYGEYNGLDELHSQLFYSDLRA